MPNDLMEKRKQLADQMIGVRETRNISFEGVETRVSQVDGKDVVNFSGYASMTERGYEMHDWLGTWTETITRGAFAKTLAEDADVMFLVNHEGMGLARTKSGTLSLSEDNLGLHVDAQLDPGNSIVSDLRSAMERGDMDEMSMAFRVVRQEWDEDWENRWINEINLNKGDVSLVNYGANPYTTAGMRALRSATQACGAERYFDALKELRAGATLSADTMSTLQNVLDLVAGADDNVDEAQVVLSELMGVPNPDDDAADSAAEEDGEKESEAKSIGMSRFAARTALLQLAK